MNIERIDIDDDGRVNLATEVLNREVVRQSLNGHIEITVHSDGTAFEAALAQALADAGLLAGEPGQEIATTDPHTSRACEECNAESGEECRPYCIGQAQHEDEIIEVTLEEKAEWETLGPTGYVARRLSGPPPSDRA